MNKCEILDSGLRPLFICTVAAKLPGPGPSVAATGAGIGPGRAPRRGWLGLAAPTWETTVSEGWPSLLDLHWLSTIIMTSVFTFHPTQIPPALVPASHQSAMTPCSLGTRSNACFSKFSSLFRAWPRFSFCSFSWDAWICSSSGG